MVNSLTPVLEADEEWFDAKEIFNSNHSWFNPLAPHAKFRVNFAKGASKMGISPDLLFAVFTSTQEGVAILMIIVQKGTCILQPCKQK